MKMNFCAGCQDRIEDPFLLNVNERAYHSRCLRCADCNQQLSEKCFYRDAKIFCRDDFYKRFGPKCTGCALGISPTDLVRKTKDSVYHIPCFVCLVCNKELATGDHFYNLKGKCICKDDFITSRHLNVLNLHPAVGSPSETEIDENLFSPCENDHMIEHNSEEDHLLSTTSTTLHSHNHLSSNHPSHHLQQLTPPSHLHSPISHQLTNSGGPQQCTNLPNGHSLSNSMNSSNPLNSLSQLSINNNSANNSLNSSSSNNLCPPLHLNQPPINNGTNSSILTNGQLNNNSIAGYGTAGLMIPNNQSNNPPVLLSNGSLPLTNQTNLQQNNLSQLSINCSQTRLPSNLVDKSSPMSANSDDLSELNGSDMLSGSPNSNPGKRRGPRTTIKAKQLEILKAAFQTTPKPTRHVREALANETNLNMRVIQVWFQNRRSKERRMNQVKSMSQRRPFNYRNNRNGRNPMRSLRNPIGDDEQSLSASGTFTYFSESSNPGDYYSNQASGALPNSAYYNEYNDYKNFNPQQTIMSDSLTGTPILTSLNGSTADNIKQEANAQSDLQGGGQQVSNSINNQLINLNVQTSQSPNSCSSTNSLNGGGSQSSTNNTSASGPTSNVYSTSPNDNKSTALVSTDYIM